MIIGSAILIGGAVADNVVGVGGDDSYIPQFVQWIEMNWAKMVS